MTNKRLLLVEDDSSVLAAFMAALKEFRLSVARDPHEGMRNPCTICVQTLRGCGARALE